MDVTIYSIYRHIKEPRLHDLILIGKMLMYKHPDIYKRNHYTTRKNYHMVFVWFQDIFKISRVSIDILISREKQNNKTAKSLTITKHRIIII